MTTVKVDSVAFTGIEAIPVEVEIQKARGLFGRVSIVGLPGGSVRESRDRVRAAIESSGFPYPRSALVINLAPADLKKDGPYFDLPLALGILATSRIIPREALEGYIIIGELALDGRVKPVPGALSAAILAKKQGHRGIVLAPENRHEAELVEGLEVMPTNHLLHAAFLFGGPVDEKKYQAILESPVSRTGREAVPVARDAPAHDGLDYRDVIGQEAAKAAMITAAAGGHNLLMIGPPGSGKTMLARRLPSILPPLSRDDSLDVSRIHSFNHHGMQELIKVPPFRAPHHTISYAGLAGGGSVPRPGEISMAHKGILFLDELPEFARRTLETLRQPMEEGVITIARARGTLTMPARITLVASMNPCPCGFRGDSRNPCICTPRQASLYFKRISGPLLDRLDLQIEVPAIDPSLLQDSSPGLNSKSMAKTVERAREQQVRRNGPKLNAHLLPDEIKLHCKMCPGAADYLDQCLKRYPFSGRGYTRILKMARTLADLEAAETIATEHVEKAVMFRVLDRLKHSEEC